MKINKEFGQPIEVVWCDACEISGWKSVNDALQIPDEVVCKTRGYFLDKTKEYLSIAHTIGLDKSNDVCGIIHIPIKWVKKIK